jgi:23S rRNA-/tRNA-specific pseudouridylate synthase
MAPPPVDPGIDAACEDAQRRGPPDNGILAETRTGRSGESTGLPGDRPDLALSRRLRSARTGAVPAGDDLPILYADEHLLVVAKPRRCLVVAAPGRSCPTLVDRVGRQLGERVHAVHRLDEDTTGMIVLARSADAKQRLEELSQ